jgi:hypothetical protein
MTRLGNTKVRRIRGGAGVVDILKMLAPYAGQLLMKGIEPLSTALGNKVAKLISGNGYKLTGNGYKLSGDGFRLTGDSGQNFFLKQNLPKRIHQI